MSEPEPLVAHGCEAGHYTVPSHPRCPECGAAQTETVDLSDRTGEVVTWTVSRATPPGVREPNPVAIVAFTVADTDVRALGQLTTADAVESGVAVEPVPADELRDPDAGIREAASQTWSGWRFDPVGER
mgnify:CR=1 FL=1